MAAVQADIRRWLERGRQNGATHLIVVCDTFDHDDYPVFVKPTEDPHEVEETYNGKEMQRVMEVYRLDMSWDDQLAEHRAHNY